MTGQAAQNSDPQHPASGSNAVQCAFCGAGFSPYLAKRFRGELICEGCAAVVSTAPRQAKPVSSIAQKAAAINTAAIAEKKLFVGAVLSLLGAGSVFLGAILFGHLTKDTWEFDNELQIRQLADDATKLLQTDERAALAKYGELVELVDDRDIRDEELRPIVEAARNEHRMLTERYAAKIAREKEQARQREEAEQKAEALRLQAEQERILREAKARAREEERRRKEAERLAAAQALMLDAYIMSQKFVKKQLKAPSSARFPDYESDDVRISFDDESEKFTVVSWVESQNGFGVYLRMPYVCRLWPTTGVTWRCDFVDLGEP